MSAYITRGGAYYDLGQYERAIQDYNEAIRLDPKDADAYYNRGIAYGKLGRSVEAERDIAKAEEIGIGAQLPTATPMPTPLPTVPTPSPSPTLVTDPDGGLIYWEQVKTGTINTVSDTDTWTFYGVAGQLVTITMTGRGELPRELDPLLELYGPSGGLLETNDDGGSGTNARIHGLELVANGTYTIVAKGQAATTGPYSLVLALGTAPIKTLWVPACYRLQ